MAYSYDFKDNVVYGADHINAIRTSILTKGVIEESDTSCKAVLTDVGVLIQQGQAVFDDGCRIEVDADGVEREFVLGQINYVYFYNNTLAGVCEVIVSTVLPEGDCVILAEIDAEGVITDKREFAELKTAETQRYIEIFQDQISLDTDAVPGEALGTIKLPKSNCSMIEFEMDVDRTYFFNVKVFPKENNLVIWTNSNGSSGSGNTMSFYAFTITREIKFEINGNEMSMILESISKQDANNRTLSIVGFCVR